MVYARGMSDTNTRGAAGTDEVAARLRRGVTGFALGWRQFWQGYWQSAHSC
jgi:hypothetical protein